MRMRENPAKHKQGLIFHTLSVAQRDYTATPHQPKLLTADAFRFQVETVWNIFFSCVFRLFESKKMILNVYFWSEVYFTHIFFLRFSPV